MKNAVILSLAVFLILLFIQGQNAVADTTKTAALMVIKHVINDDGGIASASDFTITVDHSSDVTVSPSSFQGSEEGTVVTLTGNFNQMAHFTVHEPGLSDGYEVSYSSNCSTYINAGEVLTCVITNDDKPTSSTTQTNTQSSPPSPQSSTTSGSSSTTGSSSGSSSTSGLPTAPQFAGKTGLRLLKQVNNYGGGTKGPQDFTYDIDLIHGSLQTPYNNDHYGMPSNGDMPITSGLYPGDRYQVHEELDPNYQPSYIGDCVGTIEDGKVKTCIIVNNYIPKSSTTATIPGSTSSTPEIEPMLSPETTPVTTPGPIPIWVKNDARWWSEGQMSNKDYATSVEWMTANGIITLQSRGTAGSAVIVPEDIQIPSWIKNDANWWAKGAIDTSTYLQSLQFMLDNNVITFTKNNAQTQTGTNNYDVSLKIEDSTTGQPVDSLVTITRYSNPITVETDRDGIAHFSISAGDYEIQVNSQNYQRLNENLAVTGNIQQTLQLEPTQTQSSNNAMKTTPYRPVHMSLSQISATPGSQIQIFVSGNPNQVLDILVNGTYASSITLDSNGKGQTWYQIPYNTRIGELPIDVGNGFGGMLDGEDISIREPYGYTPSTTTPSTTTPSTTTPSTTTPSTTTPSTTTLSSSANPSIVGNSVTFTATISPSTATGAVTFSIDGAAQSAVALSGGHASFSLSSLSVGSHTITATYSGDTNDAGSISSTLTQTVNQITTATTPPSSQSSTQTQLQISANPTTASFTHNIGSSPCPTPITTVTLNSNLQGTWSVKSNPNWMSVTINGNQASLSFNCQLGSYITQTLNGAVEFTFTSTDNQQAFASVTVTGQVNGT